MKDVEQAIKDIEEARASHRLWADRLGRRRTEQVNFLMIRKDEEMWVRRYDRVLRLLEKLR